MAIFLLTLSPFYGLGVFMCSNAIHSSARPCIRAVVDYLPTASVSKMEDVAKDLVDMRRNAARTNFILICIFAGSHLVPAAFFALTRRRTLMSGSCSGNSRQHAPSPQMLLLSFLACYSVFVAVMLTSCAPYYTSARLASMILSASASPGLQEPARVQTAAHLIGLLYSMEGYVSLVWKLCVLSSICTLVESGVFFYVALFNRVTSVTRAENGHRR